MRNVAKLAAAGALSLAIVSGTAFAATAPASQPAKTAVTKKAPAKHVAAKNAGDPGPVVARRLSNAEYDNSIRDLTGVDIRPTRNFPVDPANEAGFDNSGESLTMSPALVKKYVDAGLVRYEFRDLPLFGDESVAAAVAGRAAARQGRFWEYLRAVYEAAPETGHPEMPRSALIAFGRKAGVPDMARFASDLDDSEARSEVTAEAAQGESLGVDGVPFFVIDNVAVSGAQPLSVFEQIVDKRLAAHGVGTKD